MQNKTSKSTIKFIHRFILFIAFIFLVRGINTIRSIIESPQEVSTSIYFTLEEAGKITYKNIGSYDFRITNASGNIKYYPQNMDKASIPYYRIFF